MASHRSNHVSFLLMTLLLPALTLIFSGCGPSTITDPQAVEVERWKAQAANVTIVRDSFGVPHIYGKTDADAVFGLLYAQCEDDFARVEMNYINAMGRLSEIEGKDELYRDLRMRLFIDPDMMISLYETSPEPLKRLMDSFADGINYYLHTHPDVQPKVIEKFEPWMALTFSEGSIGGDIERVSIRGLQEFYGQTREMQVVNLSNPGPNTAENLPIIDEEPRGSNGIAIAPSNTLNGNALFLINPHTTFFFRAEVHMVSDEGLNAYGAVTWGQFFIYQGFNERVGWMHTSSRADVIDEYLETIVEKEEALYYLHGGKERPLEAKRVTIPYRTETGDLAEEEFTIYRTHHGPIVRQLDGRWVSFSIMENPVDALSQSYARTKAQSHDEFYKTMEIRTNSSNNTVYADADGNIVYYHGNYMPVRNQQFDWSRPVDGSNDETDYKGLHSLEEMIIVRNPENGWIQNCNSTPFTAAGSFSPKKEDYPSYMAPDNENFRGLHAVRVLEGRKDFTLESLIEAAYDSYLPGFQDLVPSLLAAWREEGSSFPDLREPIEALRGWDFRFSVVSVPTTLATFTGNELVRRSRDISEIQRGGKSIYEYISKGTSATVRLESLASAVNKLEEDFGSWRIPWGDVNRYQRLTGDIVQQFDDEKPSLPVFFHSGRWGSLASFGARTYLGTKKMYGTSGNSFVAFVEFGDRLRAKSILAGGQSGDMDSPHFDDQALMYTQAQFKEVRFYKDDVDANAIARYQPGQRR